MDELNNKLNDVEREISQIREKKPIFDANDAVDLLKVKQLLEQHNVGNWKEFARVVIYIIGFESCISCFSFFFYVFDACWQYCN